MCLSPLGGGGGQKKWKCETMLGLCGVIKKNSHPVPQAQWWRSGHLYFSLYLHLNSINLPFTCKFSTIQSEVILFILSFTLNTPMNKDALSVFIAINAGQTVMEAPEPA